MTLLWVAAVSFAVLYGGSIVASMPESVSDFLRSGLVLLIGLSAQRYYLLHASGYAKGYDAGLEDGRDEGYGVGYLDALARRAPLLPKSGKRRRRWLQLIK